MASELLESQLCLRIISNVPEEHGHSSAAGGMGIGARIMKFGLRLGVFALCAAFCHPAKAQVSSESASRAPLNLNPPGMTLHLADRYRLLPREINFTAAGAEAATDADPSDSLASNESSSKNPGNKGRGTSGEIHAPRIIDVPPWEVSGLCKSGRLDAKECRFHWWPALAQQTEYLAIETTWNLSTNTFVRDSTFHGHWFQHWMDSVDGFKFSRWNDANPISDDYVGHPMMGAITMDIFLQNYPRGMSIEFQNTKEYWHSRLWALLWSTVYSTQWKLGPISEASIGNTGRLTAFDKNAGHKTNGTGTVGLVITPLGGWVWAMGEDFMDMQIIRYGDARTTNPIFLLGMGFLNPCRSFANIMRWKAPWYRDSRPVRPHRSWPTLTDTQVSP